MEVPKMDPCVPLPVDKKIFNDLVDKAKDWALMHGAGMRSKTNFNPDSLNFAPFVLLPSTFPKNEFEKAVQMQTVLNELIHKIAHDYEFLKETLASTIKVDDFTRRLFEIYETMRKEGYAQDINLGLFRVDYLLDHSEHTSIKQVEMNTISVSFAGACTQLTGLHRFVLQELNRGDLLKHLPENDALAGICSGMLDAWKIYNNPNAVILFIIEDRTYNICDQRFHEFEIKRLNPNVTVIRKTLTQVQDQGFMDKNKKLVVDGWEVAVIYFRSGYEPAQYHGEKEWDARLMMERSLAIKCPTIHYHLAGTKKVQQALAQPKVLERFIKDPKTVEMVRDTFTGLYSLDFTKAGDEAIEMAINDPEKFVLKPQREGGGNNIYGKEIRTKVEEMRSSEERMGWILMDRIFPPVQASYIIRPGAEAKSEEMQEIVSELGIFGCIIGDEKKIIINRQAGHMFRTKPSTANEGGVAAGVGCLDSPFLVLPADMDLSESMKSLMGKGLLGDMGPPSSGSGFAGSGYVTEKLYMLLQLYLQNKGWNPSVELLQCFSELKEASMLPSSAYLQMMAQRVTLDSQGRLVLRENGKIILPFEHFGNAVMLKHMNGPQGMHLGLEATIRAVMESYTIGREQFGMEKEFIIDIVQNCPNGACRYYKSQLELSHRSLAHLSGAPTYIDPPSKKGKSSSSRDSDQRSSQFGNDDFSLSHHHQSCTTPVDLTPSEKPSKSNSSSSQSRAQLLSAVQQMVGNESKSSSLSKSSKSHLIEPSPQDHKIADFLRANLESLEGLGLTSSNKDLLALHNGAWGSHESENKRLSGSAGEVGQEKIVRAFTEIMKNMARMKTCIRPAMCKPYGKQSESLQKTLMDTVQLVQSLRQVLPPPHIAVSSWKNEDKHSDPTRKLD